MPLASAATEQRQAIQTALADFARLPLAEAAYALLAGLRYRSEKSVDLGSSAETLLGNIKQFKPELGTTDIELGNPAEPPKISTEEIAYLCAAVNRYTKKQIQPGDVVW